MSGAGRAAVPGEPGVAEAEVDEGIEQVAMSVTTTPRGPAHTAVDFEGFDRAAPGGEDAGDGEGLDGGADRGFVERLIRVWDVVVIEIRYAGEMERAGGKEEHAGVGAELRGLPCLLLDDDFFNGFH